MTNFSLLQRFLRRRSLGEGGKFITRDFAKAHTSTRAQKCRRIFFGIEQAQRRATDEVPAPGRTQRINSRLRPTNPDGTGRNFLPRNFPAWRGQLLRKPGQKWKSGDKSYAGDAILR